MDWTFNARKFKRQDIIYFHYGFDGGSKNFTESGDIFGVLEKEFVKLLANF